MGDFVYRFIISCLSFFVTQAIFMLGLCQNDTEPISLARGIRQHSLICLWLVWRIGHMTRDQVGLIS